jgi:hypothetical protein
MIGVKILLEYREDDNDRTTVTKQVRTVRSMFMSFVVF